LGADAPTAVMRPDSMNGLVGLRRAAGGIDSDVVMASWEEDSARRKGNDEERYKQGRRICLASRNAHLRATGNSKRYHRQRWWRRFLRVAGWKNRETLVRLVQSE
jgi:hypothetical protein